MNSTLDTPTLLFVDDETDLVDIAQMCFESAGWRVHTAGNITDAKVVLQNQAIDAVLSDLMMRGGTGIELLDWTRQNKGASFPFFLLTGCIDERIATAKEKGANDVFGKPCDWDNVVKMIMDAARVAKSKG